VSSSDSDSIIYRYVERILNGLDISEVHDVFSYDYRDHDPLILPGITERDGIQNDRYYVEQIVRFLSLSNVDVAFELLDVCGSERDGRMAARIRGEGVIALEDVQPVQSKFSHLTISNDATLQMPKIVVPSTVLKPTGKLVGRRLHVGYYMLAMFAVRDGKFIDKWGSELIE
jgi:hypothetical protein